VPRNRSRKRSLRVSVEMAGPRARLAEPPMVPLRLPQPRAPASSAPRYVSRDRRGAYRSARSRSANLTIKNNTVAAPLSGVRPGIRVDAGNASSVEDAVYLDIETGLRDGAGRPVGAVAEASTLARPMIARRAVLHALGLDLPDEPGALLRKPDLVETERHRRIGQIPACRPRAPLAQVLDDARAARHRRHLPPRGCSCRQGRSRAPT